jgi:hypothetical protein
MQSSAFKAWLNGNHKIDVECGREDGNPFIVEAYIPPYHDMNIIVFAYDPKDAINLVHNAFQKCIELDYKTKTPNAGIPSPKEHYDQINQIQWNAKPYDKKYASNVQWASNDGVVT